MSDSIVTVNRAKTTFEMPYGDERKVRCCWSEVNKDNGLHFCIYLENDYPNPVLFRVKILKLIKESQQLQITLQQTVGRPSSHIVDRIKALEDALACI